jgi:hypothetical protein
VTSGLVVRELSPSAASAMWADYEKAIGQVALRDAYGPEWPRPAIAGERLFEFRDPDGQRVGWGSLLHDQAERLAWHSHGIWPAYQDQRRTRDVSRYLVAWAFTTWPIVGVSAKILETNPRYREWFRKRQHDPAFAWRYAGTITIPWPEYDVYCFLRHRWELERSQAEIADTRSDPTT